MKQRTKQKLEERVGDNVKKKSRIDIIGQNGNTGEHYEEVDAMPNGRWNWWDDGEDKELAKRVEKMREKEETTREKLSYYDAKAELVELAEEDQSVLKKESDISKCWDQNEAARRKMNRHNAYNAKFWIYEEKRYGTWEESQEFYRKQDKKEARLRASSFSQSKEGRTFRGHLVAEE